MDFTLSLTHFCETHGPKSVLCTQILPLECAVCLPPSPPLRARTSGETLDGSEDQHQQYTDRQHPTPSLRKGGTDLTLPTDFSNASTQIEPEPESPNIERHPLFKHNDTDISPQFRYGRAQGETCASCSFSAPEIVADRLPTGAPGSVRADGKSKNGAPVFRSRQRVCLGASPPATPDNHHSDTLGTVSNGSAANSYSGSGSGSYNSIASHQHQPDSCHDHTLTYLTSKSPADPETYASLRASVIRTLSCELLPRGMSDGPMCFGDSTTGYTIAHVFRLTDPKARGRRRCYAFLALAGKDSNRAFRACPMLWEKFASMAKRIEGAAQRAVEETERREETQRREREDQRAASKTGSAFNRTSGGSGKASEKVSYTPVSSFLTQRAMDPDGTMRRAGQTSPRSLADIVGDETIFAILHQYFVALLKCLGDRFGGLPLTSVESVYQTVADAGGFEPTKVPARVHNEPVIHTPQLKRAKNEDSNTTMEKTTSKMEGISIQRTRTRDSTEQKPPPLSMRSTTHASDTNKPQSEKAQQQAQVPPPASSRCHKPPHHRATISSDQDSDLDRAKRRLSKTLSLSSTTSHGHHSQCAPSSLQLTQAEVRGQVAPPSAAVGVGGVGLGRERVVA